MANPIRVLIVEDRPADVGLMVAELRRAGFEPQWDLVDTEADFVASLAQAPEIVLADYSLPQWNGLAALQVLQQRELDIPLIIVTGSLGDEKAAECIRMGAADFLLKDRLGRLAQAVSQALEQKQLRQAQLQRDAALRASLLAGIWLLGFTALFVALWWAAFLFGDNWTITFSLNHFKEAWIEGPLFHGALGFAIWFVVREMRALRPRATPPALRWNVN